MLYRAIGEYEQYISRLGYAYSTDGLNFERKKQIAFESTQEYEKWNRRSPASNG
jgi:predicted GH43/DUF377 family glycosyl hydrolase